jgi:predicted esterase
MPFFLGCHVTDPHIPLVRVEESAAVFRHKKAMVTVEKYPGFGHQLMPGQVEWLLRAFQTQAPGQ